MSWPDGVDRTHEGALVPVRGGHGGLNDHRLRECLRAMSWK